MLAVECKSLSKRFFERTRTPNGNGASRGLAGWIRRVVGKREETRAVDGVDLSVERGEIFGILGPNGSGKSTLVRILATLVLPDEGSASVFGFDVVRNALEVKRVINRVSVEASFFKKLSAWENLSYAAGLYGIRRRDARQRAGEILLRLGMKNGHLDKPLEDMSRGMQQKVAIARALLTSPVLLLLDEPTTGLDPVSKKYVQDFVAEVRTDHDATVILTTHDMDEADVLCDRIAVVDRGRIVAQGTAEELKRKANIGNGSGGTLKDVFFRLVEGGEDVDE
ncbi:MAG: ABC transporter ATP-binding protein [Planctomycetota bacterium]|jgi:ABC-2 type transport system ATP-binding protein